VTNVVSLSKAKDERRLIWICVCGCTTHHAFADGAIECASCGTTACCYGGEWRERLPAEPEEPEQIGKENFKVVNIGDSENFMRRHTKDPDVRMIIIGQDDGALSCWSTDIGGTPEREAWIDRMFARARKQITPSRKAE
jgi:hypothetical protein